MLKWDVDRWGWRSDSLSFSAGGATLPPSVPQPSGRHTPRTFAALPAHPLVVHHVFRPADAPPRCGRGSQPQGADGDGPAPLRGAYGCGDAAVESGGSGGGGAGVERGVGHAVGGQGGGHV